VGVTDKLASAAVLVPTKVVNPALEYHFQLAPVPRLPPVCVRVVFPPLQIVAVEATILAGAVEGWFTVTMTFEGAATFAVQGEPVVLSALK